MLQDGSAIISMDAVGIKRGPFNAGSGTLTQAIDQASATWPIDTTKADDGNGIGAMA
jgi:hypothetical protein